MIGRFDPRVFNREKNKKVMKAFASALNLFPVPHIEGLKLKEKQRARIEALLDKKDVLGQLPTDFS